MKNKAKLLLMLFLIGLILVRVIGLLSDSSHVNADETWNPLKYDSNNNGAMEKPEMVRAINHYEFGYITKYQLVEVLKIYFGV